MSGLSMGLSSVFVPHAQRHARLLAAIERSLQPLPARDDLSALRGDWMRIGEDFRRAHEKLAAEIHPS